MTFLVALLGVGGLLIFLCGATMPSRTRLSTRVEPFVNGLHGKPSGLIDRHLGARRFLLRWEQGLRQVLPYRYEDVSERLLAAGDPRRPEEFRVEQLLWGLAAAVSTTTLLGLVSVSVGGVDARGVAFLGLVSAVTGFLARDWWLGHQVSTRRASISAELPVALDLVALAVMAGESVPAAFERVADRLGDGIGAEFRSVVADIRAGSAVLTAIEGLSGRIPDPGLARFVDAVCTGIERGAPLADVLRGQADDARDARRRHLLELGGKKEVLMLVPVVFLIMPVVVVFALYPGLVSLNLLVP